jgi:hypothetical protein
MEHIAPLERPTPHPNKRGPLRILNNDDVQECRRAYMEDGKSMVSLAERFGVSKPTISAALYGLGAYSGE